MVSDACQLSPWGIVCSRGLSQRQAVWGVGGETPASCWWCQLWGRQTAPFHSLLDPVAVPGRQVAAQSQQGSWGCCSRWPQLPPGSPCSLPPSRLGLGRLGVVGLLPPPRAAAEGRGPRKPPMPAPPRPVPSPLKHLLPPHSPSQGVAAPQVLQHLKVPGAPHLHSTAVQAPRSLAPKQLRSPATPAHPAAAVLTRVSVGTKPSDGSLIGLSAPGSGLASWLAAN